MYGKHGTENVNLKSILLCLMLSELIPVCNKIMAKLYGLGSGYPYLWAKGSLIRKEYFIKQDTSLGLHFLSGY